MLTRSILHTKNYLYYRSRKSDRRLEIEVSKTDRSLVEGGFNDSIWHILGFRLPKFRLEFLISTISIQAQWNNENQEPLGETQPLGSVLHGNQKIANFKSLARNDP